MLVLTVEADRNESPNWPVGKASLTENDFYTVWTPETRDVLDVLNNIVGGDYRRTQEYDGTEHPGDRGYSEWINNKTQHKIRIYRVIEDGK